MARLVRRLTAPIALASVLGIAPACALSLDGPRPQRLLSERPVCDDSKGLVATDGVIAAALGVAALGVADESGGGALVLGLLGTAFVASAFHGSGVVDECREASGTWERDYAQNRPILPPDEDDRTSMRMRRPPNPTKPVAPRPVAPPPVAQQPVGQQAVAPQPVAEPAPTKPAAKPAERTDGDWSSFWQETP